PFGPYGPDDRPERLIPYVINELTAGRHARVSHGEQVRDYSHVDDHVRAMLLAASRALPDAQAIFNIGSGRPSTVRELVETIAIEIGGDALARVDFDALPPRADDPPEMYADVSKAREVLGFVPRVDIVDGLRQTIASYRPAVIS